MNIFKKTILTLMIIFLVSAIPANTVKSSNFDDLNSKIKVAEQRLQDSIEVLKSISPQMCNIILNEPWTPNFDFAKYYFLNFHQKEFFDYSIAVGDLEDLKELQFYATMNDLSNKAK